MPNLGTVERSFAGPGRSGRSAEAREIFARAWRTESEASLATAGADEVRRLSASTHKSHAAKQPDG
ncbi:hypothetical protein M3625_11920 [Paenibacillus sp. MER 78]|nr:hypothetical protein [Paenibacillus sp. MER 78]